MNAPTASFIYAALVPRQPKLVNIAMVGDAMTGAGSIPLHARPLEVLSLEYLYVENIFFSLDNRADSLGNFIEKGRNTLDAASPTFFDNPYLLDEPVAF